MKKAAGLLWIDGFNLFHRWGETRALFRSATDMGHLQQTALRLLGRRLGSRCGRCLVFMDGGPRHESGTVAGLRVRYPGPGKKADDLLEEALLAREGQRNNQITVVTSDRTLAAGVRRKGARVLSVEDFIARLLRREAIRPPQPDGAGVARPLSAEETAYWLEVFGDGEE